MALATLGGIISSPQTMQTILCGIEYKFVEKYSTNSGAVKNTSCYMAAMTGSRPIFFNTEPPFFHFEITLFNCSLVSAFKNTIVDFSNALYPDFVCCCLPESFTNQKQSKRCQHVTPCLCSCMVIRTMPKPSS